MPSSRPFAESKYCLHGPMRRGCTSPDFIADVMIQLTSPSETMWQHAPHMQTGGASQSMALECMLLARDGICHFLPRAILVVHSEQSTRLSMASPCLAAGIIGLNPLGRQAIMYGQLCKVCKCPRGQRPLKGPGFAHIVHFSAPIV